MDNRGKRVLMSVLGVVICGVSVGMFKHAAVGVDPFQCLMSGLNAMIPIHFGTLYWIVNLVLLSVSLLLDRSKIGLATFINLFLLGYIAEFSQGLMGRIFPMPGLALRVGIFAFAVVSVCFSSALYFTAALGVSTYDAVALIWSERQNKIPFARCRIITDFACVLIGVLLWAISGVVGIGTLITAFFMGPLIAFFNKTVAEPFLYDRN